MGCSLPCIQRRIRSCPLSTPARTIAMLGSEAHVEWCDKGAACNCTPSRHHNNNIFEIFIYYVHKLKEWTFLMLSRRVAVSRICRRQPWQHWECGHVTRTFHRTSGPELKMNIIHRGHMYWYYIWFSLCLDTTSGSKLLESQLNSLLWTTLFTNPTAPVMDSWVRLLST